MHNIADLHHAHRGRPIFVLGTAPHIDQLDLSRLRGQVTIGVNQLALRANELGLDYVTVINPERFGAITPVLPELAKTQVVAAETLCRDFAPDGLPGLIPVHTVLTSPGHAQQFSFDLNSHAFAGDVIMLAVQLAVWLGASRVYLLGVDADLESGSARFYASSPKFVVDAEERRKYWLPDQREWLRRSRILLKGRGIALLNAAGDVSKLDVLPRLRLASACGDPLVAVTSKTFCQDPYLVEQLRRFYPRVKLNESKEKLKGEALAEFLADADAVILGTEPLTGDVLDQLPCLRYIAKYGVGLNNVDFVAAKRLSIDVAYRKGVNSDSVAELVLSHTINLLRHIDASVQGYRTGKWRKLPGRELAEITVGLVGYGHVGKVVAHKFAALGVHRLLVNDLIDLEPELPAEVVPLEYLISNSDVVSWHVSMEPQNHHLVNAELLARMRPGSLLVNTSRGELIDEDALADALESGHLGGAALDVYEHEPDLNPRLQKAPNLLTTCHIAGSSNRAIKNMGWAAIEELLKLFGRDPAGATMEHR